MKCSQLQKECLLSCSHDGCNFVNSVVPEAALGNNKTEGIIFFPWVSSLDLQPNPKGLCFGSGGLNQDSVLLSDVLEGRVDVNAKL